MHSVKNTLPLPKMFLCLPLFPMDVPNGLISQNMSRNYIYSTLYLRYMCLYIMIVYILLLVLLFLIAALSIKIWGVVRFYFIYFFYVLKNVSSVYRGIKNAPKYMKNTVKQYCTAPL